MLFSVYSKTNVACIRNDDDEILSSEEMVLGISLLPMSHPSNFNSQSFVSVIKVLDQVVADLAGLDNMEILLLG